MVPSFANSFWNSLCLITASALAHSAICVCDQGRKQIIELEHVRTGSMVVEDLLRQLPESVSKTIHQTTTPHGTIFQSLMLVAALLMLASEFPKFDFVQPNYDVVLIGFEFCRYIFPAVGIVMLVFIPMSHDYILMIDRFKRPGYQLTQEDRAVFYANKLQEDMHQFAGMLVFAATPALEGYAVGRAFVQFFGNGMGDELVKWRDQDAASSMWLILLVARTVMLLGVHVCLWNMVYEWYCEPTARFSRNPYYIYDAEKALIRHLLNYVLLVGMSIWFFNSGHFKLLSFFAQRGLLAIAFCSAVLTVCYTFRVLEYLMFKERYFRDGRLERIFHRIVNKTEKRMDKYTEELHELFDKWSKCTYNELDTDISEPECC
ncbi:unnamed protein product [Durusdinium trenchii]|uniref:Internalin-A n=2 Tax=Durusdinium trenchii TaxID=1381693 RepID=A0ABP0PQM9_9DINO